MTLPGIASRSAELETFALSLRAAARGSIILVTFKKKRNYYLWILFLNVALPGIEPGFEA